MSALRRWTPVLVIGGTLMALAASSTRGSAVAVHSMDERTRTVSISTSAPARFDPVRSEAVPGAGMERDADGDGQETTSLVDLTTDSIVAFSTLSDTPRMQTRRIISAVAAPAFEPDNSQIPQSMLIPLPPAVWTGFAGLGGLGLISVIRKIRRLM